MFINTASYRQASAAGAGLAGVPGYVDDAFVAIMTGVAVVGGAAMHAQDMMVNNIDAIGKAAKATWDSYSPAVKDTFAAALTATGDGIVVAGNWIDDFLTRFKADNPSLYGGSVPDLAGSYIKDGRVFLPTGYSIKYTAKFASSGIEHSTSFGNNMFISISYDLRDNYAAIVIGGTKYACKSPCNAQGAFNAYNVMLNSQGLSALYTFMSYFDMTFTLVKGDLAVEESGGLNQWDRWLRDRVASNGNQLRLGLPTSVPYSNTGKPLTLDTAGTLTLDGVPYSAEIQWRDVIQGLTDAGVLVVPDIMVNGKPAHLVTDKTGQTHIVDQNGVVVQNPSSAVSVPKQIVWIDGVPYVITPTGAMINIKTGEIITDASSIPNIKDPVKPIVPPVGDIAAPSIGLNFDPLLMSADLLTKKFPFSVPWDVARQLAVFDVAPEAPKWEINVPNFLQIQGVSIPFVFTLDLSMFDVVAVMIRWFNIIIWDISLLLALRRFMPE